MIIPLFMVPVEVVSLNGGNAPFFLCFTDEQAQFLILIYISGINKITDTIEKLVGIKRILCDANRWVSNMLLLDY